VVARSPLNTGLQLTLSPPPVVEVVMKIGIMRADEHAQLQLEAHDVTDNRLLSMVSRPHVHLRDLPDAVREMGKEITTLLQEFAGPF